MITAERQQSERAAASGDTVDILAVAAEEREFAGLLARSTVKSRLNWSLQASWRIEAGGRSWALVADGAGAALARHATEVALAHVRPGVVVSTGLCGALVEIGAEISVVFATEIARTDGSIEECRAAEGCARGVRLLSLDRVVTTTAEKRAWAERSGAAVVEMEAAGVAEAARAAGLPVACVRAISDTATENLPLDFNGYRDGAGRFSRGRIAAACIARPWVIPALLRFDGRCRQAAMRLGEYLVNARFA